MLLSYITDLRALSGRRELLDRIGAAAAAGVDYIQLREKHLTLRELERLARVAVAAVREAGTGTKLLINGRVDVAIAAGADGVHLAGGDVSPADVRAVAARQRREFTVAVSCHSVAEVQAAWANGADFAVFAPVFEKQLGTEGRLEGVGVARLREACGAAPMPVLALGGVTLENARACLEAGAAGVAAIRLFQQGDVVATVGSLRAATNRP